MTSSESTPGPSAAEPPAAHRTLPAHFREKSRFSDTAGTPWAGRDYAESPFPGDDGSTPSVVAEALRGVAEGRDPLRRDLVAALAASRLLVPIMAVATEEGTTAHGLTGDNGADMAMVSITAPDGTRVLPVFTSVGQLSRWQRSARPVPTLTAQAAQAAVQEGITELLLNPAAGALERTAPTAGIEDLAGPILLQRSILWALAQGRAWQPPHEDAELAAELEQIAQLLGAAVNGLSAQPGKRTETMLLVRLEPGLTAPQVQGIVQQLSAEVAASVLIAERISSLTLKLGS